MIWIECEKPSGYLPFSEIKGIRIPPQKAGFQAIVIARLANRFVGEGGSYDEIVLNSFNTTEAAQQYVRDLIALAGNVLIHQNQDLPAERNERLGV